MKISCLPVSLFRDFNNMSMNIEDWASEARNIGLDGIDISIMMVKNRTPAYLASLKGKIALPVIMATAYPDFTNYDALQRHRELDYFIADIALCSQLGVRYLRVLAGQAHPRTSRADGIRWALRNMKKAYTAAAKYGVVLLYENHSKPSAWEYTDFSYPADIFLEVLNGLRGSGIRLNFDIGNVVSLGLDPLALLPEVFDMIETIHVSDMRAFGEFAPVAIGSGVTPIGDIFKYLIKNGFDGWLCIEEASNQGLRGISQAVAYVRETWEQALLS